MSIAVDVRTTGGSGTTVAALTWNHTVGALSNGILTVESTSADSTNDSASTVQWDAAGTPVSLTRFGRTNDSLTQAWAEIWYLLTPTAGTKQIKITPTGTWDVAQAGSASYSGVDQSTPWNVAGPQSATGSGSGTQPSIAVTSNAGEWVIDAVVDNEQTTSDTLVKGASQNTIFNTPQGGSDAGAASDQSSGGASVTMSWTGVGGAATPWAHIAGSMRPAAGSGGQWVGSGSRRAPAKAGPFDQRGMLLSPYQQYSYVAVAAVAATALQRKTLSPLGTHTGGRQSQ